MVPQLFSEKPKGYSQQITDFRKSVSHRKFYTPIQQLITDNPWWVLTVSLSPLPPPFLPISYLFSPPSLLLYCTRLIITEKEVLIYFVNKAKVSTSLLQTWYNEITGLLSREQYILFLIKEIKQCYLQPKQIENNTFE